MQIVAALFIDEFQMHPAPGPSTRLDLTGVHFSAAAPSPPPLTLTPHLCVLVRCGPDEADTAALEVTYHRDGEQIARHVQPLQVDPGKFTYRLVRAELDFPEIGTVEAHVRLDLADPVVVPFTLLPHVQEHPEGDSQADAGGDES